MEEELMKLSDEIRVLLRAGKIEELVRVLHDLHPADIAEILEELDDSERTALLRLLKTEDAARALQEMEPEDQADILEALGDDHAADILEEMPADDIADLVGELSPDQAGGILNLMDSEEATDVRELLEYDKDSAGGIMTTEYISLREGMTVEAAIQTLREMAPDAETTYYVYVTNASGALVGVLSLRELIVAQPSTFIRSIMRRNVISVHVDEDQEEVARVVSKYNLLAIPVIDADNRLLGIITVDDVLDVVQEEATEDVLRMAGAPQGTHRDSGTPLAKTRKRLPWLYTLLFGEILAAGVLRSFSGTLEQVVALAYFIPVLTGMSGNVGTQSLAVAVRGLATGELEPHEVWRMCFHEVTTGLMLGVACGFGAFAVASFWQGSPIVGLVVGLSMTINFFVATGIGTLVPFMLERFNVDPAVASGPFVTTTLDVLGMAIYLGLASAFLGAFGA